MLRDLQERFWELITAPEGVERALPEFGRQHPEAVPLERWVHGTGALGAAGRVDIYANMYFYRLLEVLQGDYPKVAATIGEAAFHNLITGYLLAWPSTSPSIREVGRHLAGFLQGHELTGRFPILPDLARVEWARVEVFDRENVPILTMQDLAALPATEWASLRLQPTPALRILDLEHPAHELFQSLERGEAAMPAQARVTLLVWRRHFQSWMRPVHAEERRLLELIAAGLTFAGLCDELRRAESTDEAAAQRALDLLVSWVEAGLLQRRP